jgi:hypothetical protein
MIPFYNETSWGLGLEGEVEERKFGKTVALCDHAARRINNVISGGTPIRTGMPNVPSPRFT